MLPSGSMEFLLSTPHWLDALDEPLEKHIKTLRETITKLLPEMPIPPFQPSPEDDKFNVDVQQSSTPAKGNIILKDTFAHLALTTDPPGAAVFIDDYNTGLTTPCEYEMNLKRELKKDVYLELKLTGYKNFCGEIELVRGLTLPIHGTLLGVTTNMLVNPKDGAQLVWVPPGEFTMGSNDYDAEKPPHKVDLDGYYIYKHEVTVAQYRKFCTAKKCDMPSAPSWGWQDNHPMVNVSWEDAKAYAQWAEAALPTEAQWEKAARGTDGRIYPWGMDWDPTKCCNSTGDLNPGQPSPVGSFSTGDSPYGCLDMAGNVWEWCADWYDAGYYAQSTTKNPTGPVSGDARVLRGGSWYYYHPDYFRATYRNGDNPSHGHNDGGFRCVLRSPGF